ncbi:SUN domain-containing protein 1 isoform X1 [Crotalus tigris]|uniref:SUN domain-containing protein 1 isoform X1 n=2 Tax=Crotalus tigris TaxID=88082 RepID=UPI00192F5438|nr:SUN domain-containing protein 1 isoform X1 [Crotalus tigris]XP_039216440.1 SUN domain-containing protein 1 isoform X1 [Crotalus tigris]XP_039216442.1 SUN domain-containing protein 1 isoform X1 [Crotalus tigris]
MDFSRLHMYNPPQCLPENTGYTYALSSSYSLTALEFETEHKLDPVFDSPRMSRRSLRLSAAGYGGAKDEGLFGSGSTYAGKKTFADQSPQMIKQHKTTMRQSGSVRTTSRRKMPGSAAFSHSSFSSRTSDGSFMSTLLDESSIQEQTAVDHFWGLDDDGDLKGGDTTSIQTNGDIATMENQTELSNGYTCNDCSMLSERKEALTAYSSSCMPTSRVYSRDRSQKYKSRSLLYYSSKILGAAKQASASFTSLIVQLFQMILLKLGYDCKAHSNYCGSVNVKEFLRDESHLGMNGESMCDDYKGKKHLETYTTAHLQSSRSKRIAASIWHIFSYPGYFLLHMLQRMRTAGWLVTRKILSLLWLAVVSPGKAATGAFWWLGTGWYQLATLISLLNVFLLTRCLPKMFRLLLFFLPLLLLLGVWCWGPEDFLSLLPALNWTSFLRMHRWEDSLQRVAPEPHSSPTGQFPEVTMKFFDADRVRELEKQMALLSEKWRHQDEESNKMLLLVQSFQEQISQMNDRSEMLTLVKNIVSQHLTKSESDGTAPSEHVLTLHQEHEWRLATLEGLLAKLSEKSEGLQKEFELTKAKTVSDMNEQSQSLLSKMKHLELELAQLKSGWLSLQDVKSCCSTIDALQQKVDAQIKESVRVMFSGELEGDFPESLLQWLTSRFVTKTDLQVLLQDLEMQILRNITLQRSVTNSKVTTEIVTNAVNEAGIVGITEAQAQVIINNALRLYSQDKTGIVDFALESGGGSILSTRCSETYETKTALLSLFGIPLWYFSQSPRVVIQPDMYPGNCWAFKGSQGYLVIRLSMMIYPTSFCLEHIPKSLSPTGNITSAPKDFLVYGLENEYQEEGILLGQYTYDQDGEPLQMFPVTKISEKAFQIVELRIFSNWGNAEYTCLYRFRVHGQTAE